MLRKIIIEYCMKKIETTMYRNEADKYERIIEELMSNYFTEQGLDTCTALLNLPERLGNDR